MASTDSEDRYITKDPRLVLPICLLFLAGCVYWLNREISFARRAIETEGEVIAIYTCDGHECADIRYRTAGGQTVVARKFANPEPQGSRMAVLYDPDDLQRVHHAHGFWHWWRWLFAGAFTAIVVYGVFHTATTLLESREVDGRGPTGRPGA